MEEWCVWGHLDERIWSLLVENFGQKKSQISVKLCQWRDFEDNMVLFKIKFLSWSSCTMYPGKCGKVNKLYSWILYGIGLGFHGDLDGLPGSSVHGIFQARNIGVGYHFLLQGIFPTQGSNQHLLCLLHWRHILYHCTTWEAHLDLLLSHFSCVRLCATP